MIRRMYLFLFIIGVMPVFVMSACGSMDEGTNENSQQKAADKETITVYSSRDNDVDEKVFAAFTEETGIEVNVRFGSDEEMIGQLEDGEDPEADVYFSKDTAYLQQAQARDGLQAMNPDLVAENIPEDLRDEGNEWTGLTKNAHVILYNTEKVEQEALSTYEALAEQEWEDRIVGGAFDNAYNQSFIASLITINGTESTHAWVEDFVGNFAGERETGRDKVEGVAGGQGDVALVNSQYVERTDEQVGVFFPNQATSGTHINVSGAAVLAESSQADAASELIVFLTGEMAQEQWTQENGEYPLHPDVEPAEMLQSWGEFEEQDLTLTERAENHSEAVMLMEEAGWH